MKNVFDYEDHIKFLIDWTQARPRGGRGVKADIARHIGCNPIHVTNVFRKTALLTLEQGACLISFLELSILEGQFFYSLVEKSRAGNKEMRELIEYRQTEIIQKWSLFQEEKMPKNYKIPKEIISKFCSSWIYSAVDNLCVAKEFQTTEALSKAFKISLEEMQKVLNFLVENHFLEKEGNRYIRPYKMHLMDLDLINKSHYQKSWRNRALNSLDESNPNNFNATFVYGIAEKDIPKWRKKFVDIITEMSNQKDASEVDQGICICLDLFKYHS